MSIEGLGICEGNRGPEVHPGGYGGVTVLTEHVISFPAVCNVTARDMTHF